MMNPGVQAQPNPQSGAAPQGLMQPTAPSATEEATATNTPSVSLPTAPEIGDTPDEGGAGNGLQELETHMDSLPDEQKAFVADNLTPEIAQVLGIILGPEAYNYFAPLADSSKALIPVPRELVEQQLSQQNTSTTQPSTPVQQAPLPAEQQQTGGAGMMAPAQANTVDKQPI